MNKLYVLAGLVVLSAFVALQAFYTIDEREQAIVVQFGEPKDQVSTPGLHVKMPFVQNLIRFDKRILSLDAEEQEVLASDQRRIIVDSFSRFRITNALKAYQAGRSEQGVVGLLESIVQSTVRQVLAREQMASIVSGERAALMQEITNITNQQAESLGVEVIDVRLRRVDLPTANSEAIFTRIRSERKREAEQSRAEGNAAKIRITAEADRKVQVILANAERDAQIVRGQADAQAVKIFAEAFSQDEDFFEFYRTMQAYRKSLGKDDTTLVLSPDSEFFKLFIADGQK